ncbi:4-oxalocrotonate tautomerase family protein [Steroidobacter flavus]|uniref:4-oxalocrotonate tautomerase family protein n=1 Tax=Steroidobacter flavus TaxID=1842136 RepID=A0ABV8SVD7_9GAMM
MPIIQVNILAGRSPELKAELAAKITETVSQTLQAKPETIRVLLQEYAEGEWFVGGKSMPVAKPPGS